MSTQNEQPKTKKVISRRKFITVLGGAFAGLALFAEKLLPAQGQASINSEPLCEETICENDNYTECIAGKINICYRRRCYDANQTSYLCFESVSCQPTNEEC